MKALLEVFHLNLCSNISQLKQYIMHTLWYRECPTKEHKSATIMEAIDYLEYLNQAGALDVSSTTAMPIIRNSRLESKAASILDPSCSIYVSRFGKAIVASGLNPDDAIIIYSAIKDALNGINLELPLHSIFLVIPLEHYAYPDFSLLYNMVESAEKEKESSPLKAVIDILGLSANISTLHRWTLEKPDKKVFENVFILLRQFSLKRWKEKVGLGGETGQKSNNNNTDFKINGHKCNWKEEDLKLLGCCKRFWGAFVIFDIMKGLPISVAMKKFNIEYADIESLLWHTHLNAAKVQKFCSEIGQSAIEKLIGNLREQMNSNVPSELRELVKIPRINVKVAKLLHESLGVTCAADLIKCKHGKGKGKGDGDGDGNGNGDGDMGQCNETSPCTHVIDSIVSCLHLSLGFELKVLQEEGDGDGDGDEMDETIDPRDKLAHDDIVKLRMRSWICSVLNEAKKMVESDMQIENDKVTLLMAAVDYGNDGGGAAATAAADDDADNVGDKDAVDCSQDSYYDFMELESLSDEDVEPPLLQGEDSCNIDEEAYEEKCILPKCLGLDSKAAGMMGCEGKGKGPAVKTRKSGSEEKEAMMESASGAVNIAVEETDLIDLYESASKRHVTSKNTQLYCSISQVDGSFNANANANANANGNGNLAVSQYMTQFTPSKLPSPGKFLYLPQLPDLQEGRESVYAEDVVDSGTEGFGWKPLNSRFASEEFLKKLKAARALSFEFVYRRIPASAASSRKNRAKWANIVALACPAMASSSFDGVSTSTSLEVDAAATVYTGMRDPHILTGVAFNFGDEYSYYMNLPTLPPLYDYDDDNSSDSNDSNDDGVSGVSRGACKSKSSSSVSDINCIPLSCCVLISRFVGYHLVLGRHPHLRAALLTVHVQNTRSLKSGVDKNGVKMSNPMMYTSRRWAAASRVGLYYEWCRRSCVEWQLLGEVMRNRNITKVAVDIKSKMTCLRERDVIVRGPLEDPSIAKALLPRDFEMSLKFPDTWKSTQNSSVKVACFRAAAVIRTMATLTSELRRHHQLELFRTVEMPLLHSVSEIDYVGCPAETSFFRDLLQNLVDRQTIIKSYFDSIDKNFNPLSSRRDMQKLKDELIIRYVDALDETRKVQSNKSSSIISISRAVRHTDPTTAIASHPLMMLAREYRQSTAFASLCKSLIFSNLNGRIRFTTSTLHAETGRLSVTSPPLQQIPRHCSYKLTSRLNLHQELMTFADKEREAMTDLINAEVKRGESFWIRVREHPRQAKVRLDKKFRVGRLLFISSVSVLERPLVVEGGREPSTVSVIETWRSKGFEYDDGEALKILQCVVVLDGGGEGEAVIVPSDQLEKLDAEVLVDDDEITEINRALSEGVWSTEAQAPTDESRMTRMNCVEDSEDKQLRICPREGFKAGDGFVLLSADYSQIELRVLAHFCGDPNLCKELSQGLDVFKKLASKWKKKPLNEVTDKERDLVKSITYSFLFGAGSKLIAEEADVTLEEVKVIRQHIDEDYASIKKVEEAIKKSCSTMGFVQTLKGRRRYFPDIKSSDRKKKSKAERQCFNTVMQGTAADILKMAMISINATLEQDSTATQSNFVYRQPRSSPGGGIYKNFDDIRFILHVHDELLFEVREDLLKRTASVVKRCMQTAASLRVPLKVKLKSGKTWASMEDYILNE